MKNHDVLMDYDAMLQLADQIAQAQSEFDEMLADTNNLVKDLEGAWQGKAQMEFAVAYNGLSPKLQTINDVLKQYSSAIASAVEQVQSDEAVNEKRNRSLNPKISF